MAQIKDDILKGIIEIDGVTINAKTTLKDLEQIEIDKAVLRSHPHGYLDVIFNHPLVDDGVNFQVTARHIKKYDVIIIFLDPKLSTRYRNVIDESRAKQEVCEEWLKRNMAVPPTRDTADGIFYDFDWGHVYCSAAEHINYGHLEGGIQIIYAGSEDV